MRKEQGKHQMDGIPGSTKGPRIEEARRDKLLSARDCQDLAAMEKLRQEGR